jgi:hypothetical protein
MSCWQCHKTVLGWLQGHQRIAELPSQVKLNSEQSFTRNCYVLHSFKEGLTIQVNHDLRNSISLQSRVVWSMVFCYKKRSDLLREKNVLVIIRTICSNSESSEQFLVTECLFNLFLEFLRYNKLKQLEFKFENNIEI